MLTLTPTFPVAFAAEPEDQKDFTPGLFYSGLAVWLGVTLQVFLAGLVVLAGQTNWDNHIGLVHSLGVPLLIMPITVFLGGMPRTIKWLTLLVFVVYIIQADVIIFLRDSVQHRLYPHSILFQPWRISLLGLLQHCGPGHWRRKARRNGNRPPVS